VLAALVGWAGYQGIRYFRGRSHFQAAQEALDRHDWDEARAQLQACLTAWPDSPEVHRLAARVARRLELFNEAQTHLDTCQRLQGGETPAVQVERVLLRVHRGDLAGAEDFLRERVAQDDPDTVEILDTLSAALILKYRVAEAHRCLDDLLRRQPDHFHALVRHGWTAQSQSWYPLAVESLQKALALRPDVDNVRLSLAEIQVVLGRFEEAQPHLEYLRRRQPRNPAVLFGLARCLAGQNQKEQAVQLLDRLLADHPDDWKALGERGWLAIQLDRPAEAEDYLRQAVSLAPPDLPLLIRLSDCLRLLGKQEEANDYRDRADQLKADMQRAGQLGDQIREQSPDDPALRHELACILLRLGKPKDALHWFETALEKDPRHRPTHESLAAFYEKAGDYTRAAHHRRLLQQTR
jgi:tetratricopeptide (TPR) repeat protein